MIAPGMPTSGLRPTTDNPGARACHTHAAIKTKTNKTIMIDFWCFRRHGYIHAFLSLWNRKKRKLTF